MANHQNKERKKANRKKFAGGRKPRISPDLKDHVPASHNSDGQEFLYGFHSVEQALKNPNREILNFWVTNNMADRLRGPIQAAKIAPIIKSTADISRIVGENAIHQGVALLARPLPQPALEDIEAKGVVVILDQVTDPHNVGAIMRSCAAFDVTAMIATQRHSPDGSGVMAKTASGAVEHVPFVRVGNLARAIDTLKERGFTVVGLDSDATVSLEEIKDHKPLALVLGAEGKGLRQLTRKNCDWMTAIRLPGAITSLNVSNAAALALYAVSQ